MGKMKGQKKPKRPSKPCYVLALALLGTATVARAATFTVDAVCDNGPAGMWAIGAVSITYDATGNATDGTVNGICLDGSASADVVKAVAPRDGVLCFCPPATGVKDAFCKAHALVEPGSTVGSCRKSEQP